jgi:UDP-N-acetylmuramoyl-tripeptide--D-alanyl-D-alanine ligase
MGLKKLVQLVFLGYLRWGARLQLLKNRGARVVGITGSAGKTSLKQALRVMLRSEFKVRVCEHGNSETGIPLDVLGLEVRDYSVRDWGRLAILVLWKLITNWERFEILVVEMAVDSPLPPKNMEHLLSIVKPDIGVFLNVTTVHAQEFDKLLGEKEFPDKKEYEEAVRRMIACEKGKMIEALPSGGVAVLNFDEQLVRQFSGKTRARVMGFGKGKGAQVQVKGVRVGLKEGFKLELEVKDGGGSRGILNPAFAKATAGKQVQDGGKKRNSRVYEVMFKDEVLGVQYGMTLAAAVGVARGLGMDLEKAIEALEEGFKLPPGRMNLLRGVKGSWVIDSSYNASKLSMLEAIRTCAKLKAPRKVAVLGDMREIGGTALLTHRKVLEEAMKVFDKVVLVGSEFGKAVEGSRRILKPFSPVQGRQVKNDVKGKKDKVVWFANALGVSEQVKKWLKKDSLVLVKGSQNTIFLEALVERLLADSADAAKLCRRGEYWEKRRKEWFGGCE